MRRSTRTLVSLVVLAAVAAFAAACGPAPAPPTASVAGESPGAIAPGQAVSATAQHDGLVVTLAASSDRVQAGDRIQLRVTALNAGLGPAAYMAGGCGPIGGITVTGGPAAEPRDVGGPPQGTDTASVLALARWSALSGGGAGVDWIRTPGIPDDMPMGCPADLRYEDLDPGASFVDEAIWIARTGDGLPAPSGEYTIELAFPFAGRRSAEEVGLEGAEVAPIRVALQVAVEGDDAPAVDAVAAVDAALADAEVIAWADRALTRETLTGASISFADGRWRLRIGSGAGDVFVFVDPTSGAVVERRLGS